MRIANFEHRAAYKPRGKLSEKILPRISVRHADSTFAVADALHPREQEIIAHLGKAQKIGKMQFKLSRDMRLTLVASFLAGLLCGRMVQLIAIAITHGLGFYLGPVLSIGSLVFGSLVFIATGICIGHHLQRGERARIQEEIRQTSKLTRNLFDQHANYGWLVDMACEGYTLLQHAYGFRSQFPAGKIPALETALRDVLPFLEERGEKYSYFKAPNTDDLTAKLDSAIRPFRKTEPHPF